MPKTNFSLEIRVIFNDDIFLKKYEINKSFNFYARACEIGEVINSENKCELCPINFYSNLDPMRTNISKCFHCPKNAYCPGGSYLMPLYGYWRFSYNSTKIIKCFLIDECTGPPYLKKNDLLKNYLIYSQQKEYISGQCNEGHDGNLCFQCKHGYGRLNSQDLCMVCDDIQVSFYVKMAFTILILLVYSLLNTRAMIFFSEDDEDNIISTASKICINHIQKLIIISDGNLKEIDLSLTNFFSIFNVLSFLNENNLINECIFYDFFDETENYYLYKVVFMIIVPLIQSILCLLVLALFNLYDKVKRRSEKQKSLAKKQIYLILLISIYIFYPLVTKNSLSLINCIYLDNSENSYLYSSPNLSCWSGIHLNFFVFVLCAGIILWGLIFPIVFIFVLRKKGGNNRYATANSRRSKMDKQIFYNNNLHYAFLYRDYREKYFYWESIIFLQKFFLTFIPNAAGILGDKIEIALCVILLCYTYFFMKANPFKLEIFNRLELFSISIIMLTRVNFLFIFNAVGKPNLILCAVSVIFLSNCIFFVLAGVIIYKNLNWRKILRRYKSKIDRIKKAFKQQISQMTFSKNNEVFKSIQRNNRSSNFKKTSLRK